MPSVCLLWANDCTLHCTALRPHMERNEQRERAAAEQVCIESLSVNLNKHTLEMSSQVSNTVLWAHPTAQRAVLCSFRSHGATPALRGCAEPQSTRPQRLQAKGVQLRTAAV